MFIHMYIYTYVCVYTCTHIYTHAHTGTDMTAGWTSLCQIVAYLLAACKYRPNWTAKTPANNDRRPLGRGGGRGGTKIIILFHTNKF